MTKQYFPELDYFFYKYWTESNDITAYDIPIPEIESEDKIPTNSIFALLFSIAYSESDYTYLLSSKELTYFTRHIKDRLKSQGSTVSCYVSDSTNGSNVLSITDEEVILLDKLLLYRINNAVDISDIEYDELDSNLSKLIYQYLSFMCSDNFVYVNNSYLVSSSDNELESLFEVFVVNECHKKMKNSNIVVSGSVILTIPYRLKVTVDSTILSSKYFEIPNTPYNRSDFYVFQNGNLLDSTNYELVDTTSDLLVSWESTNLEVREDDVFIADYYIEE
jgi:hypothetical protein